MTGIDAEDAAEGSGHLGQALDARADDIATLVRRFADSLVPNPDSLGRNFRAIS